MFDRSKGRPVSILPIVNRNTQAAESRQETRDKNVTWLGVRDCLVTTPMTLGRPERPA